MNRTTVKTLRVLVNNLNVMCGLPTEAYHNSPEGPWANIGVYILDCAYGGYCLARIVSKTGGERNITPRHGAAVTADLIRAYMDGIVFGEKHKIPTPKATHREPAETPARLVCNRRET